jgi:hypothetical protein
VISDTSAIPISGTLTNLPHNSTFTVGRNSYQVSYSGWRWKRSRPDGGAVTVLAWLYELLITAEGRD